MSEAEKCTLATVSIATVLEVVVEETTRAVKFQIARALQGVEMDELDVIEALMELDNTFKSVLAGVACDGTCQDAEVENTPLAAALIRTMTSPESRRRNLLDGYVEQEIEDD